MNGFFKSNENDSVKDINLEENDESLQNSTNFNLSNDTNDSKPKNGHINMNGKSTVNGNGIEGFINFNNFMTNGFVNNDIDILNNKNIFEQKSNPKSQNISIINNSSFPSYININGIIDQNDKTKSNNHFIFSNQRTSNQQNKKKK